jgi:hypothetical protein
MSGNDFLLYVEVTALSEYISFEAIRLFVFSSTIERCRCVGLELEVLSQFFNERVRLIQSIYGLNSYNQGSPNMTS